MGFLLDSFWTGRVLVELILNWWGSCWTHFGLVGFLLDASELVGFSLGSFWTGRVLVGLI